FTMVGARFLDVDFMRINLACEPPTVWLKRFLNSQTGRSRPINWGGIQAGLFPPPRCENYLLSYARSIGAVDAPPVGGTFGFWKLSNPILCLYRRASIGAPVGGTLITCMGKRYQLQGRPDPTGQGCFRAM